MRAAILIIGSLLWDDKHGRKRWREERLQLKSLEYVQTPLEYGRRSTSRGNTFTMAFDPAAQLGKGALVTCRQPVVQVNDLLAEAEQLWKAEYPAAQPQKIGSAWGCVGVQFRETSCDLCRAWRDAFHTRETVSISPVNDDGLLDIPWPLATSGALVDVDMILATVTQKDSSRPTAEAIANAWIDQSGGNERYFFENVRSGIRTHADIAIWKQIEAKNPVWLETPSYAEAIKVLRKEKV